MIRWETESWDLKTPLQSSEEEMLDLERDVCNAQDRGLFMVPHKLTFAESLHTCKKLSGSLVSYTSSQEFDDLLYFLSLSENMKAGGCVEELEDGNNIEVWAGGTDQDKEGDWVTWNTKENIQVRNSLIFVLMCLIYCSTCHGQTTGHTMTEICTTALLLRLS